MLRGFGLANVGLLLFDVICIAIATGEDYWVYYNANDAKYHAGLWKLCSEIKTDSTGENCGTVAADGDFNSVRALLILALVLVCAAIGCILVKLFWLKERKIVLYITIGILLLAGLFLMVAFALYSSNIFTTVKKTFPYVTLHACFALCVISWLASWTAAGITVVMLFIRDLD